MLRLHQDGGAPRRVAAAPGARPRSSGRRRTPLRHLADRVLISATVAFALATVVLAPAARPSLGDVPLAAAAEVATAPPAPTTTTATAATTTTPPATTIPSAPATTGPTTTGPTTTASPPTATAASLMAAGSPYPGGVPGLLTFRGNPTRTFYGSGPVPTAAAVDWRYPDQAMCGMSTVGQETTQWCGTGWTGQPAVVEREGRTWVVFGAYDHRVHFVDADTGRAILPPFDTGDIIKGSVTIDPDGYPIVYSGSRDGRYRAIAIDGDAPRELWSLSAADATGKTRWNDDWDGSGLILDDRLVIGGENSRVFVTQLNRGYDDDGLVTVDPEVLWDAPGWDGELLQGIGDGNVSIEGSVAVFDDTVYFANSGGLVQGFDLSPLDRGGTPEQTLRWWVGDDTDATIVIDEEGMLYVAAESERFTSRADEVGHVVKLDPGDPDDPLVWSFHDPRASRGVVAGVWGTPALHGDTLLVPTTGGTLVALDREDGEVRWDLELGDHLWSSPVVVDDVLVQGDCTGHLNAYDLGSGDLGSGGRGPTAPPPLRWRVELGGCVESTPAVWEGRIYVGTRAGHLHAVHQGGTHDGSGASTAE